ncbi:MAG: 4-diphosphocytidyl-2C-methyl-D-erythritol kinase [Ferruginibacter sp.]|nr:4-diphosphocytidyl-2C-methyl-D-erythritol kinase [Ferruginibacter sp.]
MLGKRADGFHDIETIFYPIPIKDAQEIIPDSDAGDIHFSSSGLPIPGDSSQNLSVKAWQLLKNDFPALPPMKLHLHKNIPMGAGLGGGSADAAFMLKMLNQQFSLGISDSQLLDYALQLGSDCPFFIVNKPAYASGRGELLRELSLQLDDYQILVVNPGIHINTGWAFSQLDLTNPQHARLEELIQFPLSTWKQHIFNDFEKPVFAAQPTIAALKQQLYHFGAVYVSMSGTGSTVFGIFEKNIRPGIKFPAHYFYNWI